MKRALLIAGGTVGGLGAVLSITPPQLSSQGMTGLGIGGVTSSAGIAAKTTTSQSPTAAVPQAATPVVATTASTPASSATTATKKKTKIASRKVASTPASTPTKTVAPTPTQATSVAPTPTKTVAPTPTPTKTVAPPPPVSKGVSGTFTGTSVDYYSYGKVQVQITVVDGKITDAQALQAPSGRSAQFSAQALPILRQETLVAQSSQIQGVSGASCTSWNWYKSLQSALIKAGLPL